MDYMFFLIPVLSMLIFGLTFGLIIVSIVRGAFRWNKNNNAPRLTVDAKIVAKRADIRRSRRTADEEHHHYSTTTAYYVTFQFESNDRMELRVEGCDYGLLIEGDEGKLTFQGTRFLGFERK